MTPVLILPLSEEEVRRRNRRLTIWLIIGVLIAVVAGGSYIWAQALGAGSLPPLPPAPPRGVQIQYLSQPDMVDGNYITTTVLYKTPEPPAKVISYYTQALRSHAPQVGAFQELMTSTLSTSAPDALQHIPPIFNITGAQDQYAAKYVYTEYNEDSSDIGLAIDERHPKGPTLVYVEQLDQPGD